MKDAELKSEGQGVRGKFRYDKEAKKLVPYEAPKKVEAHHVQGDETEPFVSHATPDGKVFTSKSAYRRHLKTLGFVETGGAHLEDGARIQREIEEKEERQRREDIEKAYYDVKYDRVEFTEREKEQHLREQREWKENWRVKSPH